MLFWEREVQSWPGAREIAKQEILRLDDEEGQARFNVASQSMSARRFIVTLRPNVYGRRQKFTPSMWVVGCTCPYQAKKGELCKHAGGSCWL